MKTAAFKSYGILGSGRVATHLRAYFSELNLPFKTWSRSESTPAVEFAKPHSHLLFAVKDSAIEELSQNFLSTDKCLVHFSGALRVAEVFCAHPLMSFPLEPRSASWYKQIPFVIDPGLKLSDILPGLPNPFDSLAPEQRALYHGLCSLAGNSSFLLWQTIGNALERHKLPRKILEPYLHEVVQAAVTSGPQGLTGPLARRDWSVVRSHLEALVEQPELLASYKSYLQLARHTGLALPEDLIP